MKGQIRNSKSEARNKFKIRIFQCSKRVALLTLGDSDLFRLPAAGRDFDIRYSDLEESNMLKKINHVAVAVNNLEEATKFYEEVLGLTLSGVEMVTSQKTKVGFFKIGESNIELVQPGARFSPDEVPGDQRSGHPPHLL